MSDEFFRVMTKKYKHYPSVPSEYIAKIEKDQITIFKGENPNPTIFNVGDTVIYDSYNLYYLGEILKISDKCVTVKPDYRDKNVRMSLESFCYRNFGLDLDEVHEENHITSYSI